VTSDLLLEATGVVKHYGAVAALRDASLVVRPGEVHALLGANGAGKSTLVKILTGVVRPDAGRILVRGQARAVHSPAEARRTGLVSVYQEPALIPDLDVAANLRLTETPVEPFMAWVAKLGMPALDLFEMARNLPLAVLRILDLARALAIEPDVLLLDEMTAALPADLAERVLDVIARQRETGRSVIFISHRLLEISALCDRATVLRDGETVGTVTMAPGAEEQIVALMLGAPAEKPLETEPQRVREIARSAEKTPRLRVRRLRAGTKLDNVSFELRVGEVLGLFALDVGVRGVPEARFRG
jgi:ribose transport system ATP-binding protein